MLCKVDSCCSIESYHVHFIWDIRCSDIVCILESSKPSSVTIYPELSWFTNGWLARLSGAKSLCTSWLSPVAIFFGKPLEKEYVVWYRFFWNSFKYGLYSLVSFKLLFFLYSHACCLFSTHKERDLSVFFVGFSYLSWNSSLFLLIKTYVLDKPEFNTDSPARWHF